MGLVGLFQGEFVLPDVKKEVESLLFSSGKAMTEKDLSEIIGAKPKDIQTAVESLKKDYEERDTSLALMNTADGWKLNVKEQYVSLVTKIVADTELPFPLLETLSIIAYRAPATQADVIQARGTNAYEHIQALIDAGFIERRKKGRSFELGLTQKFFDYFDVPGEQKLKMILKDVKASEPKKKKLGILPVVDLPEGQQVWNPAPAGQAQGGSPTISPAEAQKVGQLDVVPIPERRKQEQFKPDTDFLNAMDAKIGAASKRNDETEADELFKKPVSSDPEHADEDYEFEPPENARNKEIFGDGIAKPDGKDESSNAEEESAKEDEKEEDAKSSDPLDEEEDKVEL